MKAENRPRPPWRDEAVQTLFSAYWEDRCEREGEDDAAARRAREWERVFGRLGVCGVWDILFPSQEESDGDHVSEIAERFVGSGLFKEEVRADPKRAKRIARAIRAEVDEAVSDG